MSGDDGLVHQVKHFEPPWCKTWCGKYFRPLGDDLRNVDTIPGRMGLEESTTLTGKADLMTCQGCRQCIDSPLLAILQKRSRLRLIEGGKTERRPVLTAARIWGIIALGIFIMAIAGCDRVKAEIKLEDSRCCLRSHDECIDLKYSVCDQQGTIDDAGVCK